MHLKITFQTLNTTIKCSKRVEIANLQLSTWNFLEPHFYDQINGLSTPLSIFDDIAAIWKSLDLVTHCASSKMQVQYRQRLEQLFNTWKQYVSKKSWKKNQVEKKISPYWFFFHTDFRSWSKIKSAENVKSFIFTWA